MFIKLLYIFICLHGFFIMSTFGYHVTKNQNSNAALQQRSIYGAATAPAFYPTFDPISILASLAFLAFLLQSFVSLFDRSRSIIPAVVSSRDSAAEQPEIPHPIKLIMRAIDEYDQVYNQPYDQEKSSDGNLSNKIS